MDVGQAALDSTLSSLYEALSFDEGARPDLERLRGLFAAEARLIHAEDERVEVLALDDFIRRLERRVGHPLAAFREREIGRLQGLYGGIAQVLSSFEATFWTTEDEGPHVVRGVNAIQLFWAGDRWCIGSILWTNERQGLDLPGT